MAEILSGREVAAAMNQESLKRANELKAGGIKPRLAIIRCGDEADDLSYQRGAEKAGGACGVEIVALSMPEDSQPWEMEALIERVNGDKSIHGCLILRPFPGKLREKQDELCNLLARAKDVDCCTELSQARLYTGKGSSFPPCTAQACMEILDYYGIECQGRRAVVLGRSLVVGKPLAMLLLNRGATVTVCHSQTVELEEITKQADIILCATGVPGLLRAEQVREGQSVIDVSMNWIEEKQSFSGDADFETVKDIVAAITPVPGGVGAVTAAVLMRHCIRAAEESMK